MNYDTRKRSKDLKSINIAGRSTIFFFKAYKSSSQLETSFFALPIAGDQNPYNLREINLIRGISKTFDAFSFSDNGNEI